MSALVRIALACLLFLPPVGALQAAYSYGDPTNEEQAHLEAINRARADPHGEAARLGLSSLFEGVPAGAISGDPAPPLTMNAQLLQAARGHSNDMLARDYFSHYTLGSGENPGDRAQAAGYVYSTLGENIAYSAATYNKGDASAAMELHDQLFIDKDYPDRGHRVNILKPDFYEVGVGFASGSTAEWPYAYYITTDFGRQLSDARAFVTGVTYIDQDENSQYNAGDIGIAYLPITILQTGYTTYAASAGGYGIPLEDGTYTLRFEGESVNFNAGTLGNLDIPITINGSNIKVDAEISDFPNYPTGLPGGSTTSTSSTSTTTTTTTSTTTTTTSGSTIKQPPVAVGTADPETGSAPLPVTFDGSGSYDPDGGSLTYEWYYAGQRVSTEAITAFNLIDVANYVFTLVVTDDEGAQDSEQITIVVTDGTTTTTSSTSTTTTTTATTTTTTQSSGGCTPYEVKDLNIFSDYSVTSNCDILVQNVYVGSASQVGRLYLESPGKIQIKPPFRVFPGSTLQAK